MKSIGNFELTEINVKHENKIRNAILVHEKTDLFSNGDCILFDVEMSDIETETEVIDLIKYEPVETSFQCVNGLYVIC